MPEHAEKVRDRTAAEKARYYAERAEAEGNRIGGGSIPWEKRYMERSQMWAAVALAEAAQNDGGADHAS